MDCGIWLTDYESTLIPRTNHKSLREAPSPLLYKWLCFEVHTPAIYVREVWNSLAARSKVSYSTLFLMHGYDDEEHNGSRAVSLLLRLATLVLALTSAVVMATASECTINNGHDGTAASTTVTFKDYPPFVYLVWSNIVAAVLGSVGIYLQLAAGRGDDDEEAPKLPGILVVVIDVAVQALLYSATGAVFAAEFAYGPQLKACAGSGDGVNRSKLFSFGASVSIAIATVAKDVPLPFSVWPAASSSSHC